MAAEGFPIRFEEVDRDLTVEGGEGGDVEGGEERGEVEEEEEGGKVEKLLPMATPSEETSSSSK